jgi:hypothetical protein
MMEQGRTCFDSRRSDQIFLKRKQEEGELPLEKRCNIPDICNVHFVYDAAAVNFMQLNATLDTAAGRLYRHPQTYSAYYGGKT